MLVAKLDVYGGEELLVNSSKNRIVILEKTDMQKHFEKWLSQTRCHQACGPSRTYPTKDLRMKTEKEALHVRVLEKEMTDIESSIWSASLTLGWLLMVWVLCCRNIDNERRI